MMKETELLRNIRRIIAVASGKGGVGKSTVAVNLALALVKTGAKVGLLDCDIYGPSIPMMLSVTERPAMVGDKIAPVEKWGLKILSMGMLTTEDTPVIWRGPMVAGILQQFLFQVEWGVLDYLVMDLPPGTGDAQLTLAQKAPISGAVIVTTPQDVALLDARRGLKMFQQVNVPVLGLVENMSYFVCDQCQKKHAIFKSKGGEGTAKELNIPLLAEIPIDPNVALGGDTGNPIVISHPESKVAKAYHRLADILSSCLKTSVGPKWKMDGTALNVVWDDGHSSLYDIPFLRGKCQCAACVDEWTGERKKQSGMLPSFSKNTSPVTVDSVGQYGLQIKFSDGHATGIYTFDYLRSLCPCPACISTAKV